jgi:hypothetical protein
MLEEKKKNKIWLKVLLIAFYLFILAILLHNSFSYLDPDFGWHMKTGELILQTQAVPDLNIYDYTLAGTHWVEHEWLTDIFIYLVYHNFGYIALSICFALIILLASIIQLQFARKIFLLNDRGLVLFLILQAFGIYACFPHLGIRAQETTVLFLLLLSIIIYFYNKNKNYKILFWLIPLFVVWASAHGGFLIGPAVLGLFIFIKAVEWLSAKKLPAKFLDYSRALNGKQLGIFAIFSAIAAAATLATPYGWHLYSFLLSYQDNYYQLHISEWQGQYVFPLVFSQLIYLEIVFVFLALVFISAFVFKGSGRQKFDLYNTVLVLILAALAFKSRRHFPLLFIISLPIIVKFYLNFFKFNFSVKKNTPASENSDRHGLLTSRLISIFLLIIIIFSSAFIAVRTDFTNRPEKAYCGYYPCLAVDFLRLHPEWDKLKIFNEFNWGGYLIWQDPARQLFLDGRLPQYPMGGSTALREYEDFYNPDKMAAQLQKYDISLVLIDSAEKYHKLGWWDKLLLGESQKKFNDDVKNNFTLLEYLRSSLKWRSVYDDGVAQIFIKK